MHPLIRNCFWGGRCKSEEATGRPSLLSFVLLPIDSQILLGAYEANGCLPRLIIAFEVDWQDQKRGFR